MTAECCDLRGCDRILKNPWIRSTPTTNTNAGIAVLLFVFATDKLSLRLKLPNPVNRLPHPLFSMGQLPISKSAYFAGSHSAGSSTDQLPNNATSTCKSLITIDSPQLALESMSVSFLDLAVSCGHLANHDRYLLISSTCKLASIRAQTVADCRTDCIGHTTTVRRRPSRNQFQSRRPTNPFRQMLRLPRT